MMRDALKVKVAGVEELEVKSILSWTSLRSLRSRFKIKWGGDKVRI